MEYSLHAAANGFRSLMTYGPSRQIQNVFSRILTKWLVSF